MRIQDLPVISELITLKNTHLPVLKCAIIEKTCAVKDRIFTAYDKMPQTMIGSTEDDDVDIDNAEKGLNQENSVKKKAEREPFGKRQWAWLFAGTALVSGLSILLRDQKLAGAAMLGAWIDFIRVAYSNLPENGIERDAFRIAAVTSMGMALSSYFFTPANSIWNAVPWMAFTLSIFVKCEFNKWELDKKLVEKYNLGADTAKWITNGGLSLAATALTAPRLPALIQAPAAITAKSKTRELTNICFSKILAIKDSATRKACLLGTYLLLPAIATLSFMAVRNLYVTNAIGVMGLAYINTTAVDTIVRLAKNFFWALSPPPASEDETAPTKSKDAKTAKKEAKKAKKAKEGKGKKEKKVEQEEQSTWKKAVSEVKEGTITFFKAAPRAALFMGMAYTMSYFLEKLLINPNLPIGLVSTMAQEANIVFKPLISEFVGPTPGMTYNLMALTAMTIGGFQSALFSGILVDTSIYSMKKGLRPPKIG